MRIQHFVMAALLAGCVIATPAASLVRAQEPSVKPATPQKTAAVTAEDVSRRQDALRQRFVRFEKTMRKLAELMQKDEPVRAALLLRAIRQSHEGQITSQMQRIVDLIAKQQLGDAGERQVDVMKQLKLLLDLLESEDRINDLREDAKFYKEVLKDLKRVIARENDIRAATERRQPAENLIPRQDDVKNKVGDLVKKIDDRDAEKAGKDKPGEGKPGEGKPGEGKPGEGKPGEGKPGEGKPGEGKPGEGKPGEGKPGEGKPGEGKPGEAKPGEAKPGEAKPGEAKPGEAKPGEAKPGEAKPGEAKPGEAKPGEAKPGEGKPGEGKPGEGKPGQSDPNADKTPGRDDIQAAKEELERAIKELQKEAHDAASAHQDEALKKLAEAKEKLEEILRQLREEERKILLAALEARFQNMAVMQKAVLRGTVRIDQVAEGERASYEIRSRKLAQDEEEIALEADKALTLLREEGSSVAFPEAVEQLREDMLLVARRLKEMKVGELTQGIEKDIIEALEEIIEALQKEMEKLEEKEQEPMPPPENEPQDPPLVDQLAELKMLRSLQMRINRRTRTLGRLIDGEQATDAEVVQQLQDLSKRQARIQKATYDLATGRNK